MKTDPTPRKADTKLATDEWSKKWRNRCALGCVACFGVGLILRIAGLLPSFPGMILAVAAVAFMGGTAMFAFRQNNTRTRPDDPEDPPPNDQPGG
jgi:hypothetical protein